MASLKSWIVAARLRTIPLAISGVLIGTTLAANYRTLDCTVFGLNLLTAILLQVLSNFANDYGDAVSGVDSEAREGPPRMVQTGTITQDSMKRALLIFSLLSLGFGSLLLYRVFADDWFSALLFFVIGLGGIAAAIKYTVGANPYGYAGFGDLFVFLFFGLVAVFGTFYLQASIWEWSVLLPAVGLGLFSVGVLNLNNIRDIESDRQSGKASIPVRMGKQAAATYHMIILIVGMLCFIFFTSIHFRSFTQLIPFAVFGLFIRNIIAVKSVSGRSLDAYLKQLALSTLLFSILFSLFESISRFF